MRVVLRCCLLVTLVLNGLAGARAAAALAGSAMLPVSAATAPAVAEKSDARSEGLFAPALAFHASATGHCADVTPAASPAGGLHGRDCCQDACQCACTTPAHAPAGLVPPLAAGPGPGRVERSDWSSLRPAPLLRPPIA